MCIQCGKEAPCHAKGLCKTCYNRRWREENREESSTYSHHYYEEHREERLAYEIFRRTRDKKKRQDCSRRWQQNNHEKDAIRVARRYARQYRLPDTLTQKQGKQLLAIGQAMYPGEKLHLDHVIPLSRGGGTTFANMHAVPASLNCSKGNVLPEKIYRQLILEI